LLYDRTFLAGSFRRAWAQRWRLYAGLAATWIPLAALVAARPRSGSVGFRFANLSALDYALTQCGVIVYYLRLAVWPHPLVICYDDWPIAHALYDVWPAGLTVLALLMGTAWALWRKPWLGFLGAWFFIILAPTSSVLPIQTEVIAERRMYLPLIPIIVLVVLGGWEAFQRAGRRRPALEHAGHRMLAAMLVLTVAAAVAATARRNQDYHTHEAIWADTLNKRPRSAYARSWLGVMYCRRGQIAEGMTLLEGALNLNPGIPSAHANLADTFQVLGRLTEALPHYEQALRLEPSSYKTRINYGLTLEALGRHRQAMGQFQQALSVKPDDPVALAQVGRLYETAGKPDQAIEQYVACLRSDPRQASAHARLGRLLGQQGRAQEAVAHLLEAIRLVPEEPGPYMDLGCVQMQTGHWQQARASFENALRRAPQSAELHYYLGLALQQQGALAEAISAYRRASALDSNLAFAANNLAWILATAADATLRQPDEAVTLAQRALELSGGQDPAYLDTLAAAYAAAGRFDDAVQTVAQALELARKAGQDKLAQSLTDHLARYQRGEAYVEGVKP
jgi:tetratricopeptide (TPR) repeat protein